MTERGFYPQAIIKNIPPGANDPAITPRLAILHVAVSEGASLHDYFATRSGGVESHFYVRRDGTVEQYRSIYFQADANLDANDFAVSVETQGMGAGEWTAEQLTAIKRLLVWLHKTAGVPYEVCQTWDGHGVGYHVMFGAPGPWTPSAKTCPGPDRIKQFKTTLTRWLAWKKLTTTPVQFLAVRHRIVTANLFVGNPAKGSKVSGPVSGVNQIIAKVAAWFRFEPDVIACQETHKMLRRLEQVGGYNVHVADEAGEAGRELAVLLNSKHKFLSSKFHPTVTGAGEGAMNHPRGMFVVRYIKRGVKVAVINTHGPVFGEDRVAEGAQPGEAAEQHAKHAQKVARIVSLHRAAGYTVFVTADANSRGTWDRSLPAVLKAAGMRVVRNGVDLIACDPKMVTAPDVRRVPKELTGSDHHDAIAIRTVTRKR